MMALGLSKDLKWLYSFVEPLALANCPKNAFILLSRTGAIGYGAFPEIPWHKQEGEDILKKVGVKVEFGEEINYGKDMRTYKTIGDEEHLQIIELHDGGLGMGKIAQKLGRSPASINNNRV